MNMIKYYHIYLNESVERETHPLPTVEETLAQLAGATVFSKLDANCRFWQIPLDEQSRPLTTFITPFGRQIQYKIQTRSRSGVNIRPPDRLSY